MSAVLGGVRSSQDNEERGINSSLLLITALIVIYPHVYVYGKLFNSCKTWELIEQMTQHKSKVNQQKVKSTFGIVFTGCGKLILNTISIFTFS